GPGAVLHHGQGKWYPGEPLPRWALSCFWRADGQPVWQDAQWLADETRSFACGPEHAATFIDALARRLGVAPDLAIAGYEDAFYYLWKEGCLPPNLDPLQ